MEETPFKGEDEEEEREGGREGGMELFFFSLSSGDEGITGIGGATSFEPGGREEAVEERGREEEAEEEEEEEGGTDCDFPFSLSFSSPPPYPHDHTDEVTLFHSEASSSAFLAA